VTRLRLAAYVAVAGIVFTSCGGGDDSSSANTSSTVPSSTVEESATPEIELPPEIAAEIRPVEVTGESLPELGKGTPIADDPALGMVAPTVVGEDFDGNTVRIDPVEEGPTMVVFLAHWCPHCNAEVPRINELRDAGRFPESLNIVGVSTGLNPGRPNFPPSKWFQDMDWTYPVIADGIDLEQQVFIATDAYGVDAYPFIVLLDGEGKVVARWSGERQPDEMIALITENLGP
jgi:cytochrome c biogenesis protein CcmG, thiol:disulfide interchange protein DsbE